MKTGNRFLAASSAVAVSCILASAAWGEVPAPLTERAAKPLGTVAGDSPRLIISPNGDRVAYLVRGSGKDWHAVLDGRPEPDYDFIESKTLCFSPDGKRIGYYATRNHAAYFVFDGKERTYAWNTGFAFSPDGKHVAWGEPQADREPAMIRDGRKEDKGWGLGQPIFSPDSQHLAYRGGTTLGYVVIDGRRGPTFEEVKDPVFSPNSRQVAYAVREKGKWSVVCGRTRSATCDEIGDIAFSPDGGSMVFAARAGADWRVVGGKMKEPAFTRVRTPVFSPAGGRMAYAAGDGDSWHVVCDGKKSVDFDDVGDPVFSNDGKRLAFWARRGGKAFVVCDGREAGDYGLVSWVGFSPDGRHLAAAATRGAESRVVVSGLESPAHGKALVPDNFDAVAGKMRYVVIDKDDASLVEVDWPKDRTWEDAFKPAPAAK